MKILNLTQHPATPEQIEAGVVDLGVYAQASLKRLLTVESPPTNDEISDRAKLIASLAGGFKTAMIGGAPFLMSALEREIKKADIKPVYAFSKRESIEETLPDGSVRKSMVFRHEGFVEV